MTGNFSKASLRLYCASSAQLDGVLTQCASKVLGVLAYAAEKPLLPSGGVPSAWVALPVIGEQVCYEVWVSAHPVITGSAFGVDFASDGNLLFGRLVLDETGPAQLESEAFTAYSAIFDVLDGEGFPTLLRVWNYFPRINETGREIERYREFNIGRHDAFCDKKRNIKEGNVPAACALGTRHGSVVICFLAGKLPGVVIENPRQVNAYRYPSDFGPRSPTFARGVLVGDALLISGTASIVGYQSVHAGDVMRQLVETLENLRLVIAQARQCGFAAEDPGGLCLNVYLRHAADYPAVRTRLAAEFGNTAHIVYLQADVCRADLLVEIEAFWVPAS